MRRRRSFPESQNFNPWRPPDWRWRRAIQIIAKGWYASVKRDDAMTCAAVRLIRKLNRGCTERAVRNLTKREPRLMMALKLHQEGGARCLEVNSRVLARQSAAMIAEVLGLTSGMVQVYTQLFFSVEDRINAPGYVTNELIKLPVDGSEPSPAQLMMAVAYHHGPAALEAYLDYMPHRGDAHDLKNLTGRTRESFELLTAVHALQPGEDSPTSLGWKAPYILETGSNFENTRAPRQAFAAGAAQIAAELPWKASETAPETLAGGHGRADDRGGSPEKGKIA